MLCVKLSSALMEPLINLQTELQHTLFRQATFDHSNAAFSNRQSIHCRDPRGGCGWDGTRGVGGESGGLASLEEGRVFEHLEDLFD